MTNEELRALNARRRIHQIAWVTRDLEKSMKAWVDILQVGPWMVLSFTNETVKGLKVGGEIVTEPFKFLIALSWIGDTEVEIIQPVYGSTIYEHFRVEGRRTWFETIDEMQKVSDDYLVTYNTRRPHRGRGMNGRTPITVFKAGLPKPEEPKQKEKSPAPKLDNQLAA